jgi:hypothetical protein
MAAPPTRFADLLDLARLPYFRAVEGRLVLADPALGPAIDLHTHLALTYVVKQKLDLRREWPQTEHYLPSYRPFELDVYANRNFAPEDMERLTRDLSLASVTDGGMRRTHTVPNLAREMKELGVRASVLLPIDFPFLSENATTWLEAIAGREDFVGFGSVHPYTTDVAAKLDRQKALGARGVKVHPAVQNVRPDLERCKALYRLCGERDMAVFFHCGPVDIENALGRYLSQVRFYEEAIAECPGTTFVLGHSGALQMPEALGFAKKYPNVWLEIASQSLSGVERLCAEAPDDRLLFGTDWPFYHQAMGLAKVFLATEGDDRLRKRVLHQNAERLLGLSPA